LTFSCSADFKLGCVPLIVRIFFVINRLCFILFINNPRFIRQTPDEYGRSINSFMFSAGGKKILPV